MRQVRNTPERVRIASALLPWKKASLLTPVSGRWAWAGPPLTRSQHRYLVLVENELCVSPPKSKVGAGLGLGPVSRASKLTGPSRSTGTFFPAWASVNL